MRWPPVSLAAVLLLSTTVAASADDAPVFGSVQIFTPEQKHNHSSCVVETANGDLFAAWYSGSGERKSDDVVIQGAWLRKGEKKWGPRFLLADTPGYPDCNPALFAAPDKTIWLFWPTILDHRWEGALLKYAVAKDDGKHDGPPAWVREGVLHVTPKGFDKAMEAALAAIPDDLKTRYAKLIEETSARSKEEIYQRLGWMPRVHVTVLPSGRWLLPLYTDTFSVSLAAISDDQGKTWTASQPIIGLGNIQPSFVRKDDGTVVAYMRDNGPFHKIRVSRSHDDGETWSPVESSEFPNPGAGVEAIRLSNGHWAIVYNDLAKGRHSLVLSLSDDEGETWKWSRPVERKGEGEGSFHYPSLLQTRDGMIHVTFTDGGTPKGSTIRHTWFNEAWVRQGEAAR